MTKGVVETGSVEHLVRAITSRDLMDYIEWWRSDPMRVAELRGSVQEAVARLVARLRAEKAERAVERRDSVPRPARRIRGRRMSFERPERGPATTPAQAQPELVPVTPDTRAKVLVRVDRSGPYADRVQAAFEQVLARIPEAVRANLAYVEVKLGDFPPWLTKRLAAEGGPSVWGMYFGIDDGDGLPTIALHPECANLSEPLLRWLVSHELAHAALDVEGRDAKDEDAACELAASWGFPHDDETRAAWADADARWDEAREHTVGAGYAAFKKKQKEWDEAREAERLERLNGPAVD